MTLKEQIEKNPHIVDVNRRHDFVLLFDVTQGNPNGDPDAGNLPRFDPETMHGLVTDVCLKRKVRDYVARRGTPIFIQSTVALNSLILKAFRDEGVEPPQIDLTDSDPVDWLKENCPEGYTLGDAPEESALPTLIYAGESSKEADMRKAILANVEDTPENSALRKSLIELVKRLGGAVKASKKKMGRQAQDDARKRMCDERYDIRMFGAVLSTGLNAGQVRGPMQLTFARSIDPIFTMDCTITRQARTTQVRMETGTTEMGRKPSVPYGLYRAHGFYSPYLGTGDKGTGITSDDLALFWTALTGMFDEDHSAARGEMVCRGVLVFTHKDKEGNARSHKLFDLVKIEPLGAGKVARSFDDYRNRIAKPADGPVKGFADVTFTALEC